MMASVSAPPVALLIIDMQAGSFVGASPSPDLDGVVGCINAVADAVRKTGGLVVFIQHDALAGEIFAPGEPGWAIIPELSRSASDPVVHKEACDAFYQTELEALLHAAGIRQLLISGSATDFCVDTTVRAAASLDFGVTVVRDGLRGRPTGAVLYSPMIAPVFTLILTTVPRDDAATLMKGNGVAWALSCN